MVSDHEEEGTGCEEGFALLDKTGRFAHDLGCCSFLRRSWAEVSSIRWGALWNMSKGICADTSLIDSHYCDCGHGTCSINYPSC